MEAVRCTLCSENSFVVVRMEHFSRLLRTGAESIPVITVVCRCCGHVFTNPRMDAEETQAYYANYFRVDFDSLPPRPLLDLYEKDLNWITEKLGDGQDRSALEVGCYSGYFLDRLRSVGWRTFGVEPSDSAASVARERYDLPVITSMLEDLDSVEHEGKYDLIVLGAVLEHMPNPLDTLLVLNRYLRAGGHLFVRVPNVECLTLDSVGDIFTAEHPNMFSPASLHLFYERTGFSELHSDTHPSWPRHIISLATKTAELAAPRPIDYPNDLYPRVSAVIRAYGEFVEEQRERANEKLRGLWAPKPKRVIVFGAGNHTEYLLRYTELSNADIVAISDNNPGKWGEPFLGYPVVEPTMIRGLEPDAIIISSRAFQSDIYESLRYLEEVGIEIVTLYDPQTSGIAG